MYTLIRPSELQSVFVEDIITFLVLFSFSLNADQMFCCSLSLLPGMELSQGT